MIVITLTKVPRSLRGDLTKWYQEIQTGVYVGNVSARVRELVWERIMKNIGSGEATMVYNAKNEVGYQFRTTRKDREVVDFDGIPLMMHLKHSPTPPKHGFSDMAKFHRAKVMSKKVTSKKSVDVTNELVAIDLETTGLKADQDQIISIGAVKSLGDETQEFYRLIKIQGEVPEAISQLTGISTPQLIEQGVDLADALLELKEFVGSSSLVGYNSRFDELFLSVGFRATHQPALSQSIKDLMPLVKKTNLFLSNYRLETVLADYQVVNKNPHHALSDAEATLALAIKLMENGTL
ncbi:type I-E CRISPR-associated endoribonuclease Cas2e [Levilactobacillus bambusae]|uniref:DNA polymerase III polC-type n=1 Tax=Levilactobacillus bambusae TaxID=2024736 RepID=A0A2V1MZR9_9LACO|nr:type I-E CRISPR-associated endoribonuclease Cas2e [Levilactobacillus bambusae]PWG00479.1 type I-E CRISPR-associated endoribonuclease Cas2 [Levilactobacillus bambusae]